MGAAGRTGFDTGILESPSCHFVGLEHTGPFPESQEFLDEARSRLLALAVEQGADVLGPELVVVYHCDPEATPSDCLETTICLQVAAPVCTEGALVAIGAPSGFHAVVTGRARPRSHAQAWWALMLDWLPTTGWRAVPALRKRNSPGEYRFPDGAFLIERIKDPISPLDGMHSIEFRVPVERI